MTTETRSPEFHMPSPEETARLLADARRMRAEAVAAALRGAVAALRRPFAAFARSGGLRGPRAEITRA